MSPSVHSYLGSLASAAVARGALTIDLASERTRRCTYGRANGAAGLVSQRSDRMISKLPALCALSLLWAALPLRAEPLPLEAFTALEATKAPVLSPDGRYLAVVSSVNGRGVALVRDLTSGGNFALAVSADANGIYDLQWCYWANAS